MSNQLYRSQRDKMLTGVCGGIAEFCQVDSTLIRLATVVATFLFQPLIIVYIIAAFIVPKGEENGSNYSETNANGENTQKHYNPQEQRERKTYDPQNTKKVLGWTLVLIGAGLLSNYMFPQFYNRFFWPFLFIGAGAALIYSTVKK